MKIESSPAPAVVTPSKTSQSIEATKDSPPEGKVTSTTDSVSMRNKMRSWFSRAGIFVVNAASYESDIRKRLNQHQQVKAQRKLSNLENIMGLAMDYCLEQGSSDDLDPDWFFNFVDLAENVNSPAMQELWGKIFSVEIGHPGTFSIRTLQILQSLTHRDAKILKLAVSLASRKKGEHGMKLLFGFSQSPSILSLFSLGQHQQINLASYGLAYPDILSLMDLGLMYSSEIESGEFSLGSRQQYRCNGDTFHLSAKRRGLTLKYYKFTATGCELAKLVQAKSKSAYLDDLKNLLGSVFEVT